MPHVDSGWILVLLAVAALWFDMRRENRRMDSETQDRHVENQVRFTQLETQIEPIAKWFNNGRTKN